ncbi:MAG: hypothetical protein QNJ98_13515 [Planctomycetota bacterium]|nr:hypothetical protein [Planctomycetota bacterium]
MGRWYRSLWLLLALGVLAGCVEVEETIRFDSKGGGTYRLDVRWQADLWQRLGGVVGTDVLKRVEGRAFPLRPRIWRNAVAGLPGIEAKTIEATAGSGGTRRLQVELTFRSLEDLFRIEMLARRSMRVTTRPTKADPERRITTLEMRPITAVSVLDPVAAIFNAADAPPAEAARRATPRDPAPLDRVGLKADEADMVRRLLEPALEGVRFTFRVEVPGVVLRAGGQAVSGRPEHAEQQFDFAALRNPRTDRRMRMAWRVRRLDTPPTLDHQGDRADAVRREPGR